MSEALIEALGEGLSPKEWELFSSLMRRTLVEGQLGLEPEEKELLSRLPPSRSGMPGRPPAITREVAAWIVALAKHDLSLGEICTLLSVGRSTVKRALRDYPGSRAALTRARTLRLIAVSVACQKAVEVAIATGDWRAAMELRRDLRRVYDTEKREQDTDPEALAMEIAERLEELHAQALAEDRPPGSTLALDSDQRPAAVADR